jgi:pimeloyl-ACP methyl ester carboxylesterase
MFVPATKSTIVRLSRAALRPSMRTAFTILGHAAPGLAATWALDLFFTPRGRRGSRRIRAVLADARRFDLTVRGQRVAAWSWGDGPAVYLVHGWAGVGGQLAAFVPVLTAHGFRAVAFDAPGHGDSEGRRSSIVHFADALQALTAREGNAHAVIAHSLGAAAALRAITRGVGVERAVFIGPTGGPRDWSERFRRQLGVPPHVMAAMRERSERWLGARWEEFDVPMLARGQSAPLLILHDRDDEEVPWSDGAAIAQAWPGARLVTTTGLGHRRILRDERVVGQAVAFVRGEPLPAGPGAAGETTGCEHAEGHAGLCDRCALEASLFFREERGAYSASWKMMPSV